MFMRILITLIIAAAPLALLSAADDLALSARDDAFIHQVLNGSSDEIRNAEAALKRSLTDLERELAKHVIAIHQTVQRVLATIARNKQIATRDEVQADEQGQIVSATIRTDRDFNAFFLKREIASASAEIALFEVELRDGTDADLKLFAQTYLPSLQKILIISKEFAAKY
jgi:predicted outer membrane protein